MSGRDGASHEAEGIYLTVFKVVYCLMRQTNGQVDRMKNSQKPYKLNATHFIITIMAIDSFFFSHLVTQTSCTKKIDKINTLSDFL